MDKTIEIGGGAPAAQDIAKPLEERYSRETVVSAFNSAFDRFEKASKNGQLDEREQWAFESIREAKKGTAFEHGKDTYANEFFKDPKNPQEEISQEEGVPVEELLAFLQKETEDYKKYPPESQQHEDLIREKGILNGRDQSKRYSQLHEVSGPVHDARLHHEANLISKDVRGTGSELDDWEKAQDTLRDRLELVLPEATETPEKPVIEEPPAPEEPIKTLPPGESPLPLPIDASVSYVMNVGAQNEDIRKLNAQQAEMRIQERLLERFPTKLPQNRILRIGRLVAHTLNPHNWGKILFNQAKEYYRQIWMQEHYQELRAANFGATNALTQAAATRALEMIKTQRASGKTVVERMKIGGGQAEEIGPTEATEVSGEMRIYILDQVLKPTIEQLTPLLKNGAVNEDQINQLENTIQQKLSEYVSSHQDDAQVAEFFGRNTSRYGDLSEFYASDIMETARKIVMDGRADQLAQGQLDELVKVRLFRARWGEQTEARFNLADRLMAAAQRNRLTGRIINPATVGIIASTLTFFATKPTLGLRAASLLTPVTGLATGMAFAGLRRNWDLKQQYKEVARRAEAGQRAIPGTSQQREKLEEFLPDMATVDKLINGGGEELVGAHEPRKSIAELTSRFEELRGSKRAPTGGETNEELTQITQNLRAFDQVKNALARRYGEIEARSDFPVLPRNVHRFLFFGQRGVPEGMGLIAHSSRAVMEHERLELVKQKIAIERLLTALEKGNMSPEELKSQVSLWNQEFIQNRTLQERAFARYRLGQSLESAVGAGIIGGAIGLGLQEAGALGLRATGYTVGQTVIEQGINYAASALGHPEVAGPPLSIETFQQMYQSGGSAELGNNVQTTVNPDQTLSFTDKSANQPIPLSHPVHLEANGHLITTTPVDQLPQKIHDAVSSWEQTQTPTHSLQEQLRQAVASGMPKTFRQGLLELQVQGSDASITNSSDNNTFKATVDTNGALHVNARSLEQADLERARAAFAQNNFETSAVVDSPTEAPSNLDGFKDALAKKETRLFRFNNFDATVDGANHQVLISGVKTGQDFTVPLSDSGELTFDGSKIPRDALPVIKERLEAAGFTTSETHIAGETKTTDVLEHFRSKGELEKAMREFWHDNDTPMHLNARGQLVGADGKELQFYHRALKDGVVDLDMSQMVSQMSPKGGVNWDLTIDRQYNHVMNDIITNPNGTRTYKNFEFLITPNDAADKTREVIRATVNPDGHLQLPKGGELSQFFEIKDGKVVQLARFVEVAHVEHDASGNITGRTILSTSVGKGMDSTTTTIPSTDILKATPSTVHPPIHNFSFDAKPPLAYELTPPSQIDIPLIPVPEITPIPLAPEPLFEALIVYGYGSYSGEGLGWVKRDEYEARRSQRLKNNPYAKLSETEEVTDYFSRMDPKYRERLEDMDKVIDEPMSPETRVVITIPAFGEGKIIYKTLEQFLNQKDKNGNPLNPNLYEIIVFENDTEARPKDQTETEIQRFKKDHPDIKVYYAYKRWTKEDIDSKVNTIGNGRKYNCDLALVRNSKRSTRTGDLIIVNNDADLEGISPRYIADVIDAFDSDENIDTVVGKRNLDQRTLQKPNVRAGQRLWETFDTVMRHTGGGGDITPGERKRGWPGMIGENSAMRASIYAAVGGYGPHAKLAEDQNLGDMVRTARNYDYQRLPYLNRLETIKNPRRYLTYMVAGKPLIDMYNDYHENKDIRNLNNDELLRRIPDTFDVDRFQLDADGIYQKKKDYGHLTGEEFDQRFKKTMDLIGAEYNVENGHVKITNIDRLLRGLNRPIPPINPPIQPQYPAAPPPTPPPAETLEGTVATAPAPVPGPQPPPAQPPKATLGQRLAGIFGRKRAQPPPTKIVEAQAAAEPATPVPPTETLEATEKKLASTIDQLPLLKEGFVRLVHLTHPNFAKEIVETGLDYSKQGMIDSTARAYGDASQAEYSSQDPRFNYPDVKAVILDISEDQYRLYRNVFDPNNPGKVPAEYVVGVINAYKPPPAEIVEAQAAAEPAAQPLPTEDLHATITAEQPMQEKKLQVGVESIASIQHSNHNEDSFFINEEFGMAGVFDGMGGIANGALASKTAKEKIEESLSSLGADESPEAIEQKIKEALFLANEEVRKTAPGGGTTAVVARLWTGKTGERKLIIGNIGDSRAWLRKSTGTLLPITEDDSGLYYDFLEGYISEEEYKKIKEELDTAKTISELSVEAKPYFTKRNVIARYLGMAKPEVETKILNLDPGDLVLLTSDGIHDNLTIQDINQVLNNLQTQTPQAIAQLLTLEAEKVSANELQNSRAKPDDMTTIVLKIP